MYFASSASPVGSAALAGAAATGAAAGAGFACARTSTANVKKTAAASAAPTHRLNMCFSPVVERGFIMTSTDAERQMFTGFRDSGVRKRTMVVPAASPYSRSTQ